MKILLIGLSLLISGIAIASETELKILETNQELTLEANSCPMGYRSAISVLPFDGFEGRVGSNASFHYNGDNYQQVYPLTNKVKVSVKCFKISCILAKNPEKFNPFADSYLIALQLEDGVRSQFLTRNPMTKENAEIHIQNLMDRDVCKKSRKRRNGYGQFEEILPYQARFPHNID